MALNEELVVKARGLATYQDKLSEVPEGSLNVAKNIVIDKDGLYSPRRGYSNLDGTIVGAIKSLHTFTEARFNHLLAYRENGGTKRLALYDDDLSTWSDYPTAIEPPATANTIKTAQANKNLYLTSSKGVQKLDSTAGSLVDAGAPEGLDTETDDVNRGTGIAIPGAAVAQSVAYRTVWGYRDNNNNLVLGPPSQRVVHNVLTNLSITTTSDGGTVDISGASTTISFTDSNATSVDFSPTLTSSDLIVLEDNSGAVWKFYSDTITTSVSPATLADCVTITKDDVSKADFSEFTTRSTVDDADVDLVVTESSYDVELTVTIPAPPVDATWFIQVYRTAVLAGTTAVEVGDPGDDMGLVLERNPSAGEITAQEITLTDQAPDELRGIDLYTNSTQQGIVQANYAPPQCIDMALYQSHMFYANTETKYEVNISLLAVDSTGTNTNALTIDDTVTLDSVVYTGKATEAVGSDEFLISDSVSPSDAIEDTARSLIKVINKSASNSNLWAVYESGEDEVPGKIRVYERDFGDSPSFTIASDRANAWSPDIGTTAETSDNEAKPNRLYFSKFQQPESVPLLNFFDVGAANDEILRILPLRSILLIFTTAGTYKLTGATTSSFQVSLLDDTAVLEAPDSLVALNNNAVGLFDQGIAQVSYGSVQILSRPIEGDINAIRGATSDTLSALTFGISYETDRKYMIGLPTSNSDTQAQIVYVYNTFTQSWTTYDLEKRNGLVRKEDDKVYFCDNSSAIIQERKSFDDTDFVDPEIDVTATLIDVMDITLTSAVGAQVGYQYYEDSGTYSLITAVDLSNNIITVEDDLGWTTGAAEIRPFIDTVIEWNPITADSPNILKQFSEATLLVNKPITQATIKYKTLTSGFFESVSLVDNSDGPWGLFTWGDVPWGGSSTVFRYRTWVPREKQRDSAIILRLEQETVFNDFEISGWSMIYRNISQRVTR